MLTNYLTVITSVMAIVACMRCSGIGGAAIRKGCTQTYGGGTACLSRNRRRLYSSYCGEIGPAPITFIARDFKAEQPNQKWLTESRSSSSLQVKSGCHRWWTAWWKSCELVSQYTPRCWTGQHMLDSAVETLNAGERPVIHSEEVGIIAGQAGWKEWMQQVLSLNVP